MIGNPRRHYISQRAKSFSELSLVPELRRAAHVVSHDVTRAERRSREMMRLRIADPEVMATLEKQHRRNERLHEVTERMLVEEHENSAMRALGARVRNRQTSRRRIEGQR